MSENMNENVLVEAEVKSAETKQKGNEFKFFKCCSASLKKFSVLLFIINVFFSVALLGVVLMLVGVKIGFEMLSLLALPIITVFIIMIIIARLVSALVYGFAEIVEKHEKN